MLEASWMKVDLDGDGKSEERDMGGIARIASLIDEIRSERCERIAVVSVGDDLMNRYFHTYKGEAIFRLMSMAGYDTYAFGNHEFDKGPEVLAAALAYAEFDCLCTDLAVEGTVLEGSCDPWIIRDYDGLKVGFFSIMTEGFPYVTSGNDVKLNGTNLETAHRAVRELRANGANLVVALTHVGLSRDMEIAREVPGIDIIFGGHSHDYTEKLVRIGGTLIVNGGEKGPYLVRLDVSTGPGKRLDLSTPRFELIPVTDDVAEAEDVAEVLAGYMESFPEAIVLGRTDVPWDLSKDTIRGGESAVANLVNDHLRGKFGVDIVMNNAGAFRGKRVYPAGPVTDSMLHEIDEFGNYAYSLGLEGHYVLEVLERSAALVGGGGFLHVSGLRYTIDLSRTAQVISQDAEGRWIVETPGERVTVVEVADGSGGWAPLYPDCTYRIMSNSFMVKHEGDGYFWLKRYGFDQDNTYSTFYSILAEIVSSTGVLNPGEPDGRVAIIR
jgi:5'-nucleotidase